MAELKQISDDLNQKIHSCPNEDNSLQSQYATLIDELITIKSSFSYKIAKQLSLVHPVRFVQRIKEKIRFTKNIRLISGNSFFDAVTYLKSLY